MLEIVNLGKEYEDKVALDGVDLSFPDKGLVIIKGESGSGKTTLLNLLTAHDTPTTGKILFDGVEITAKNSEKYRKSHCSNIYQDYMLIEDMTVSDNIELALQAYGEKYTQSDVEELLKKVGMPREYLTKQASKLSGGEKQRVSIARAIAKEQAMIFADEPTGNLDSQNGEMIMEILKDISKDRLVVVVSHNEGFNVKYADYTVELVDGVVESCDLPQIDEEERQVPSFERKSKLKAKTLIKLTSWGFKKNKAKSAVSIVAFVALCLLGLMFTVLSFADMNYAFAKSLDRCENKNFIASFERESSVTYDNMKSFEKKLDYSCSPIYSLGYDFYWGEEDPDGAHKFNATYQSTSQNKNDTLRYYPQVFYSLVYNSKIGMDVDVICGDFPKEYHEIMLPHSYAKYMSQALMDYKCDDVKELMGKEVKYGYEESYIQLKICGIFDEGKYFTDFEKPQSSDIVKYYYDTNMLASCAVFHPDMAETWINDARHSHIVPRIADLPIIIKSYENKFYEVHLIPCGYDKFNDYTKEFPPLEEGEVYLDESTAQYLGLNIGDTLDSTQWGYFSSDSYLAAYGKYVIKDTFEIPGNSSFVMFPTDCFIDAFVREASTGSSLEGYYFNMKKVRDVNGYLNKITKTGHEEKFWFELINRMDKAYTENINVSPKLYYSLSNASIYTIPIAVVLLIGMVTMGFVSVSYLLASKGNSYNTLRALGFGKGHIAIILAVQVFMLIGVGLIIGVVSSAIICKVFSNIYLKSKLGAAAKISTEVLLVMGYKAPLIVTAAVVLLGAVVVLAKIVSLFRKPIAENKQTE